MKTEKADLQDQTRSAAGDAAYAALVIDRRLGDLLAEGIDLLLEGGTYDSAPTSTLDYARRLQTLLISPSKAHHVEANEDVVAGSGEARQRELLAGAIDEVLSERRLVARYPVETIAIARKLSMLLEEPSDDVAASSRDRSAARPISIAKGPKSLADVPIKRSRALDDRRGR